jgi:L-histidine N-alpha-methyltransferase
MSTATSLRVDIHLTPGELRTSLRADALAGLTSTPKELPPKWFYDPVGCSLFDAITRLDEYYPTRREREILYSEAGAVARLTQADTLVELGPGSGEKTVLLLDALAARGTLQRFVPLDVSEVAVRALAETVAARYAGIEIHALAADFERHLHALPDGGRRLVAFLGGTIGNLLPRRRVAFLGDLCRRLEPEDALLLGADLVKDVRRLEAAYDDPAGVTAAFNLNVLSVLNRELGADFRPRQFEHVARFDAEEEWIEMILRSRCDQRVSVAGLELEAAFAAGEEMRTEVSAKFRPARLEAELGEAGFEVERFWTDARGDFSLVLARPL